MTEGGASGAKGTATGRAGEVRAVWLHGAGLSAATWDAGRTGGGLLLDLPGHGERPRAPEPSAEAFAAALLPELPERMDIVGHSLGAMVAMVIAARHPGRVRRLVLADPVIGSTSETLRWQGAIIARLALRAAGPRAIGWLFSRGAEGETRDALRRELSAMSREGLRDALTAAASFETKRHADRVRAPTLVLAGSENAVVRRQARRVAELVPDARFEELPGGHMLHVDCPDRFYPRVAAFLERPA